MTSVEVPYSIASALPSLTVLDITNEVRRELSASGRDSGIAYVSPLDEVALVRVQERESGFFSDLEELLTRLVPAGRARARAAALHPARPARRADPVRRRRPLPRPVAADPAARLRPPVRAALEPDAARLGNFGPHPGRLPGPCGCDRRRLNSTPVVGTLTACSVPVGTSGFSAGLAFALLALIAELTGRSLTHRLNVGQHVSSSGYSGAEYYPFLLAAVKLGVALLLARLAWRFVRAHTAARAGRRVLAAVGKDAAPRRACGSTSRRGSGRSRSSPPRPSTSSRPTPSRPPRALAAARALAAHLGAAGLRRARRARRARLGRGRLLAARVRALRRGHLRPRRTGRARRRRAAARRARPADRGRRRESSSASPSRADRLPCPRNPRTTPRARGTVSSRPGEVE